MNEQKWRELLGLVEALGNVKRACEVSGVSRSLYYKRLKLGKVRGNEPIEPRPRQRTHPQAIAEQVKMEILSLARANPEWGCQRISYYLELKGIWVSAATVNKLQRNDRRKKG